MNYFLTVKTPWVACAATALLIGATLTGCGGGNDSGPQTPAAAFEVTSAPDKTTYGPGETVRVTITARNRTNTEQVFYSPTNEPLSSSITGSASTRPVFQFPLSTLPTVTEIHVAAGESLTRTYEWNQTTPRSVKVPRGRYIIRTTLQRLANTPTPTPSPSASPTNSPTPTSAIVPLTTATPSPMLSPSPGPTANPTSSGFGGSANLAAPPVAIQLTN